MELINFKITPILIRYSLYIVFLLIAFIGRSQERGNSPQIKAKELYLFKNEEDVLIRKNKPVIQNQLASFDVYDEKFSERQKKLDKNILIQKKAGFFSFTILGEKKKISQSFYDSLKILSRKEFLKTYSHDAKVFIIEREGDNLFMYSVAPIRYN